MSKKSEQKGVLRTFRFHEETMRGLQDFLAQHPEVNSLNHLVEVALREFVELHKDEKSWLKLKAK